MSGPKKATATLQCSLCVLGNSWPGCNRRTQEGVDSESMYENLGMRV